MNLTDLNPRWATVHGIRCGLWFDCPSCRKQTLRVLVTPVEGQPPTGWHSDKNVWKRIGTDFHNITLDPSLDFSATGHWHGSIKGGIVSTVGVPTCTPHEE